MPADTAPTFMVEDAQIIFRNLAGKEGPYNSKGDRNFGLILSPEMAQQMLADGWNVKKLKDRGEGDEVEEGDWYIQVKVSFDNFPPNIFVISSSGRLRLDEKSVETLDWADIQEADVFCRGYIWDVGGKSGCKAYVKTMVVTINEDPLEKKYAHVIGAQQEDEE